MAQKILFLQYLQALVCIAFLGKMEKSSVSGTVHPATLAVPHWFLSVSAASFPFNFASALWSKGERRSSSKEVVEKMVAQQDFRCVLPRSPSCCGAGSLQYARLLRLEALQRKICNASSHQVLSLLVEQADIPYYTSLSFTSSLQ